MDGFKEFQGKSLDEAIRSACAYYDTSREKLEIDIVQDAKSGIFGLVGARKALVKARRAQIDSSFQQILKGQDAPARENSGREGRASSGDTGAEAPAREAAPKTAKAPKPAKSPRPAPAQEAAEDAPQAAASTASAPSGATDAPAASGHGSLSAGAAAEEAHTTAFDAEDGNVAPRAPRERAPRKAPARSHGGQEGRDAHGRRGDSSRDGRRQQRRQRPEQPPHTQGGGLNDDSLPDDLGVPCIPFEELDKDKLLAISQEVITKLVTAIVEPQSLVVDLADGHVNARIDCGDDSGLLIGREGQTLAALQYMASRIVSRHMGTIVRVQLDAGEYRLRQDEKLRDMALALAEKVRATGRSYSTRPLSSYHRRIVHMMLQDAPDIQTRSSGDGPLKRVVVQRKRS